VQQANVQQANVQQANVQQANVQQTNVQQTNVSAERHQTAVVVNIANVQCRNKAYVRDNAPIDTKHGA
jgi:uncharacterized protein YjbI with pentapeptide repeats